MKDSPKQEQQEQEQQQPEPQMAPALYKRSNDHFFIPVRRIFHGTSLGVSYISSFAPQFGQRSGGEENHGLTCAFIAPSQESQAGQR